MYSSPQAPTERAVATVLAEVLGSSPLSLDIRYVRTVPLHMKLFLITEFFSWFFFNAVRHSLLAIGVIWRLRRTLNVSLNISVCRVEGERDSLELVLVMCCLARFEGLFGRGSAMSGGRGGGRSARRTGTSARGSGVGVRSGPKEFATKLLGESSLRALEEFHCLCHTLLFRRGGR